MNIGHDNSAGGELRAMMKNQVIQQWFALPAKDLLKEIFVSFGQKAAIGTSFQKTGVVTIDITARVIPEFRVFTIDTGRLFPETHEYMKQIAERYHLNLEVYTCNEHEAQKIVAQSLYQDYLFLQNQTMRRQCCYVRKIMPRNRALQTLDVWIAGLRRDQSEFRSRMKKVATVSIEGRTLLKVAPLFDWTEQALDAYIHDHHIPVHPLYAQGYKTIGCQYPCSTLSIEGEDLRTGRWRWEQSSTKECGFHLENDHFERGH
jgi:phosphoadenosine phosphosulfate reductase